MASDMTTAEMVGFVRREAITMARRGYKADHDWSIAIAARLDALDRVAKAAALSRVGPWSRNVKACEELDAALKEAGYGK